MAIKKRPSGKKTKIKKRKSTSGSSVNIRKEIRSLALRIIQEQDLRLEELSKLADEILKEAAVSLKHALPASRRSGLRQVVDGIADAWAITIHSSTSAVRHARKYGIRLAKRDLSQISNKLKSLEQEFSGVLQKNARRLGGDLGQELKFLSVKISKTGTAIRPAIQNVSKAISQHGPEVIGELALSGINVGKSALSGILLTASDVLEGIGKSVKSRK